MTSLKYVHISKQKAIMSFVNDVEMWILEEKKFIFVNKVPILGQLRWKIWLEWSFP